MDAGWVLVRNADARRMRTSVIVSVIIWTCALPFFALFHMQNPALDTPSMNPVFIELAPFPEELSATKPEPKAETLPKTKVETLPETVPQIPPQPSEAPRVEAKPEPEVAEVSDIDQRSARTAPVPAMERATVAETPVATTPASRETPAAATREIPTPIVRDTPAPAVREIPAPAIRETPSPAVASVPLATAPVTPKPAATVPPATAPVVSPKPVTAEEPVSVPTTRTPTPTTSAPTRTRTPSKYQTQAPQVSELSEQLSNEKISGSEPRETAASGQATGSNAASQPRVAVASGARIGDATERKVGEVGKNLASASTAAGTTNTASQVAGSSPSVTGTAVGTPIPGSSLPPGSGNLSGSFDFGGANTRSLIQGTKRVTIPPNELRNQPDQLSTMVSFVIEPGGTVLSSTIRFEPPLSPAIEAILRMAFSNWQFSTADSDGRVEFRYSIKVK